MGFVIAIIAGYIAYLWCAKEWAAVKAEAAAKAVAEAETKAADAAETAAVISAGRKHLREIKEEHEAYYRALQEQMKQKLKQQQDYDAAFGKV